MNRILLLVSISLLPILTGCAGLNERMNARMEMDLRERQAYLDAGYVPVPAPHYHGRHYGSHDPGRDVAFEEGYRTEDRMAEWRAGEAEFKRGQMEGQAGMPQNPSNFATAKYLLGWEAGRSVYLDNARRAGGNARRSH